MLMIITALMRLEFVNPSIPLLTQLTVKAFSSFARGFCLFVLVLVKEFKLRELGGEEDCEREVWGERLRKKGELGVRHGVSGKERNDINIFFFFGKSADKTSTRAIRPQRCTKAHKPQPKKKKKTLYIP